VNNPPHYGQGQIEAIEYIKDFLTKEEFIGYLRGNIAKYLHRWRYKNGLEDLRKAQWYLNALIEVEKNDVQLSFPSVL
jgi:antitoxin component YwqK of YwqJK toxin-antitoxin module